MSSPKRTAKRFPMQLPVTLKYLNGGIHEDAGRTVNLSAGGIYFEISARIMEGDEIELTLPLPEPLCDKGKMWVHCLARVVWVEVHPDGTMGIGAAVGTYELQLSQA